MCVCVSLVVQSKSAIRDLCTVNALRVGIRQGIEHRASVESRMLLRAHLVCSESSAYTFIVHCKNVTHNYLS